MDIYSVRDRAAWECELQLLNNYDIYHTYGYHKAHCKVDGGEPVLFVVKDGGEYLLLPLLEREFGDNFKDASSVYGYPGPVTNSESTARFKTGALIKATSVYWFF